MGRMLARGPREAHRAAHLVAGRSGHGGPRIRLGGPHWIWLRHKDGVSFGLLLDVSSPHEGGRGDHRYRTWEADRDHSTDPLR